MARGCHSPRPLSLPDEDQPEVTSTSDAAGGVIGRGGDAKADYDEEVHEEESPKCSEGRDSKRARLEGSCNCEELRSVQCHLETKELWEKFHDLGTEMIITKSGR